MSPTFELDTEKKPGTFVVAEYFNDIVPAVIALAAVHGPLGERTSEDRAGQAVRNVLLRPLHRDLILRIVSHGRNAVQERRRCPDNAPRNPTYSSASPKSAARFSNLVNSCRNTNSTFPTGPLRCLASSNSACPRKLSSCGR